MNTILKVIGMAGLYVATFIGSLLVLAVLGFIILTITEFLFL